MSLLSINEASDRQQEASEPAVALPGLHVSRKWFWKKKDAELSTPHPAGCLSRLAADCLVVLSFLLLCLGLISAFSLSDSLHSVSVTTQTKLLQIPPSNPPRLPRLCLLHLSQLPASVINNQRQQQPPIRSITQWGQEQTHRTSLTSQKYPRGKNWKISLFNNDGEQAVLCRQCWFVSWSSWKNRSQVMYRCLNHVFLCWYRRGQH